MSGVIIICMVLKTCLFLNNPIYRGKLIVKVILEKALRVKKTPDSIDITPMYIYCPMIDTNYVCKRGGIFHIWTIVINCSKCPAI